MAKFAILTDSGSDIPPEIVARYPIYVAPLSIIYRGATYLDGVDISADAVIRRFDTEIPTTSLPSIEIIQERIRTIRSDGYDAIMVITISSGLSGTIGAIRLAAGDFPDMHFSFIDTKNIAIGAGMVGAYAATLMDQELTLEEAELKVLAIVPETKVFFCIPTLDYLRKGGRIGLVAGFMGSALGLRPVITCNADGIYDTISKARGWTKAKATTIEQAVVFRRGASRYNIAVSHTGVLEEADEVLAEVQKRLPDYIACFYGIVSPALTVHTGPGLIGVCIQRLPG